MNGSALKKQELIDLLKTRVPADQAAKVEAAVTGMMDAIKEEVAAEIGNAPDATIREQVQNLTQARDEAAERARDAEAELAELREAVNAQIEAAKKAVAEEYQEEVDSLHERLEAVETEKDKIAAQIREDANGSIEAFKSELVTKISRFMEGKMNGVYERLQETIANDPTALHESYAFRKIAELVGQHQYDETAAAVSDNKVEAINEELVGLRAQVRHLEARNARLVAENKVIRESKEDLTETPVHSGKADLNPAAGLADQKGNVETGDKHEPKGDASPEEGMLPKKADNTMSESARVRDLLSEAFASSEKSDGAQGESAGWISPVRESRHNRSERAKEIEGQGLGIQSEDLVREETGTIKGKRVDENVIVPGTSTTRREFAQLAGIKAE